MRLEDREDLENRLDSLAVAATAPAVPTSAHPAEPRGLYRIGFAYGRLIYRLRWLVLALWVLGLAVSVPFAAGVSGLLTGGGQSLPNSDSARVSAILRDTLHQPPSTVLVVFQSAGTSVTDPAYAAEVAAFVSRAQTFSHVTHALPAAAPGADGATTYVTITFDTSSNATEHALKSFRALLPTGAAPARAYLTGGPAVSATFSSITSQDTASAEEKALPVALLVLLVVFGTLVAALLPLLLAAVAVPVALAVIYPIAAHTATSVFVINIASIIGLGIAIDYSLFMTRRFREELARGRSVRDAVGWTVSTAGEAILFSGLTVMIGFLGLLVIGLQFMFSFGIGGAVVVAVAVSAALTLLPALLGILGTRVNALRLPFLARLTVPRPDAEDVAARPRGFWHAWANGVMRRPVLVILFVTILLIGLGWPLLSINIGTANAASLPAGTEARQGLDMLSAQYPAANENPVLVVAQSPDGSSVLDAANLRRVDALSGWIATLPHVTAVTGITRVSGADQQTLFALYASGRYAANPALAQLVGATTAGGTTVLTVKTDAPMDSAAGKQLIADLRDGQEAHAGGLAVLVGGSQADSLDFNSYLYGNFPRAILFVLLATFALLLIMFRSLLLPLKAVLMNVLSVSAAYGVLVFVFQMGHFSGLLGFTSDGFIDSTIPILLFCILFGLSMDYEVFLLSRIREEWLRTGDNRQAVALGLAKTGGVITNAALLFVLVTGAFTFTRVIITKEVGLGMAVAVLVDATVIRTLLVPATMRLLGRWNWWLPGRALPPKQSN